MANPADTLDRGTRALLQVIRARLRREQNRWVIEAASPHWPDQAPVELTSLSFDGLLLMLDAYLGDGLVSLPEAAQTAVAAVADRLPADANPFARALLEGGETAIATLSGRVPVRSPSPDSPYPWDRPRTSVPPHRGDAP